MEKPITMNKKTYLTPAIGIMSSGTIHIICTSATPTIQSGGADIDNEQERGGYMLSKGSEWNDIWD